MTLLIGKTVKIIFFWLNIVLFSSLSLAVEMPKLALNPNISASLNQTYSPTVIECSIQVKVKSRKLKQFYKNQANIRSLDATSRELQKIMSD